jgi:hypothetical protein
MVGAMVRYTQGKSEAFVRFITMRMVVGVGG